MKYIISVELASSGFTVSINKHSYPVHYPSHIWRAFPKELHLQYAEFIAFMTTMHFALKGNTIKYLFPSPIGESFFYHGLLLGITENLTDEEDLGYKTSDYLKFAVNSFYDITFTGFTRPLPQGISQLYKTRPKKTMIPFSFGKDSLLTYAVCKELKLDPILFYFLEPIRTNENKLKYNLIKQFNTEFGEDIQTFAVPLAQFKQWSGMAWGWDIFLTQYTMFLIPFLYYHQVRYFFWSNEYSCNQIITDKEGFRVSPTFDQSKYWLQVMNTGLRLFGCTAQLGSIIESLPKLSVLAILHHRYPKIALYQTSCILEARTKQHQKWCGKCSECAHLYVALVGLGIDPRRVGFEDNMFKSSKSKLFTIFSLDTDVNAQLEFTFNEKLYAFYLATKQGATGQLIDLFKKTYLKQIRPSAQHFKKTYFSVYPSLTTPEEFQEKIVDIFQHTLRRTIRNW